MTKEVWFAKETTKFYAPYNQWYSILCISRWYNRLIHSLCHSPEEQVEPKVKTESQASN